MTLFLIILLVIYILGIGFFLGYGLPMALQANAADDWQIVVAGILLAFIWPVSVLVNGISIFGGYI